MSIAEANAVVKRVDVIMANTGQCPVNLPVTSTHHRADIQVVTQADGINTKCAVVATVLKASYPLSYLKGRTLTIYSTPPNMDWYGDAKPLYQKTNPQTVYWLIINLV